MTDIPNSSQRQEAGASSTPEGETPFIEMRGISKRFGGVRALIDVSFSIRAAEIHCLAGENGCGKSTLIKILSGVHPPDEGQIILEGKPHSHLSPAASQRFGVQIIYQDLSLFPNLSVAENIAFGHHVQTPVRLADPKAMRKQAQAVMERLKISLPLGGPGWDAADRHAAVGGHLSGASGGANAADRHGRANRFVDPPGSGCASGHHS